TPLSLGRPEELRQGTIVWGLAWPESQSETFGPCISRSLANRRSRPLPRDVRGQPVRGPRWAVTSLWEIEASLVRGLSGGLIVTERGELLGLTTALPMLSGHGSMLSYALPLDLPQRQVLAILRIGRQVEYGFLGVDTEDVSPHEMRTLGITDGGAVRI